MQHYLKLAGIYSAACATASFLFLWTVSVAPEDQRQFELVGTYFCLSFGYLAGLSSMLCDLFTKKRIWTNPLVRFFGVPLLGCSVGLFILGWVAIIGDTSYSGSDLTWLRCYEWVLFCKPLNPLSEQAVALLPRAVLLCVCKSFVENGLQYAALYAALAMLGAWLGDTFRSKWVATSLFMGALLPLPIFFVHEFVQFERSRDLSIEWSTQCWLILGSMTALIAALIVWSVRRGWWKAPEQQLDQSTSELSGCEQTLPSLVTIKRAIPKGYLVESELRNTKRSI
jgi:hypothetical protein